MYQPKLELKTGGRQHSQKLVSYLYFITLRGSWGSIPSSFRPCQGSTQPAIQWTETEGISPGDKAAEA
jgi:hypothetical protein